jgi:hypothetical protein
MRVVVFVVALMFAAGFCSTAAAKASGGYDAPIFRQTLLKILTTGPLPDKSGTAVSC